MARFFALSGEVAPKPYRVTQGAGVLSVGVPPDLDPTAMPANMTPVGLTDNDIEVNPNVETSPVRSAQMYNPYAMVETGWAFQMTASIDQIDPYNLALAYSYDVSDSVTLSSVVTLSGQNPSPYRGVRLRIEGSANIATQDKTTLTMNFDFYKAKVVANGGLPVSPETKSTLPMMFHGLANSSDVVGVVWNSVGIAPPSPAYG